jgi:hypothetical protein
MFHRDSGLTAADRSAIGDAFTAIKGLDGVESQAGLTVHRGAHAPVDNKDAAWLRFCNVARCAYPCLAIT